MKLKILVPVFTLVAMFGLVSVASARPVHDFSCDNCHKAGEVLDDITTVVCLDCHTTGHESDYFTLRDGSGVTNPVGDNTFVSGDASDALGSSSAAGVTPGAQTSHNWGAADNNPAAGASAPLDPLFYGRNNYSGALVSCSRCHDPHGENTSKSYFDLTTFTNVTVEANPQLLKLGANSANAMCLDCHKQWDQTANNGHLTHPLQANYAAFQAANPTKYQPFITPNGELALDANGNMTCTTCHGTHFVDSDASTPDGAGNTLLAGDGKLLKGDGVMTGDKTSLCTSCHLYKGHGASNIGCLDCHSGHSYNGGTPNYFVLRDAVSLTAYPAGAPANPGTGLAYTSTTFPWKNSGNGYCEGCHTLPTEHNGFATGTVAECSSCHTHDDSNASFTAGDCTACHGYAPSTDTPGGPTGYAVDGTKNYSADPNFKIEANTAHAVHANTTGYKFACSECHAGNTHDAGTFQDVFNAPTSFVTAGSLSPAYDKTGNGTCSAVYCHSNGGARGAAPVAATIPVWENGAAVTCASCHGNDATTMSTAGNSATHQAHLAKGYDCSLCHVSTATNANTLAATAIQGSHVNGVADVAFDNASSLTQLGGTAGSYSAVTGTCNTIYCHSDGSNNAPATAPDWDLAATGACGTCHNVTGETLPGAHNKHVFAADGPKLSCATCHTHNGTTGTLADHVNGFTDTVANLQTAVCNVCHGVDAGETAPVWATPASANCISCHTGASLSTIGTQAPNKNTALTSGHNRTSGSYAVSGNTAANRSCEDCHDAAQPHLVGTGNLRLQAAFSCTSCHSTMNNHQGNSCLTCHDPHGTSNIYMVKTSSTSFSGTVAFTATTGNNSYDEADAANGDDICATCHTNVAHNRADATGSAHNEGADCFSCHLPHTDATPFGVGAGTSCDGCHSFPPATAAHAQHSITTGNTIATSDRSDCAVCHTGADNYTYSTTDDLGNSLNHSNAAGRVTLLTAAVGFNNTDKTCATACHISTVGNGGTWTNGATLACDACHYSSDTPTSAANTAAGRALTGTHAKHFDAGKTCADCHTVPASGDVTHNTVATTGTDAQKIQGLAVATMDEADILGTVGSDVDPGNATCSNIACHDASDDGHAATWTVANAVGCAFCHSETDPATKNHTAHLNAATTFGVTINCNSCHVDNGTDTAHLNGTVDMAGEVTAFTSPNCTNNCHQNGRTGAAAVTATWGMAAQANCTICHIQQPATGSHAKHLASTPAISCSACHDNTVDNTTAASQHLDLNIDAFDATPADLGYPADKTLNTAFTTCNAAACHTDGTNTNPVVTPVWGTNSACVECHTTMTSNGPNNGSHAKHMTTALEPAINCGMCHASTTNPDTDTEPGFGHRDGNIDVMEGYPVNKIIGSAYASCTNAVDGALLCHDNGLGVTVASPIWGTAKTDCSTCHMTQPATGSHAVHLASGATCGSCHNAAVEGTTAPAQHGDNNVDVYDVNPGDLGYLQDVAKGNGTWASCNTASCHNNGQSGLDTDLGNVGASNVTTPTWGTTSVCGECHVATPTSAKHDEHLGSYGATCSDCHAGAIAGTSGGDNHSDGLISVGSKAIYTMAGSPGNGWGTCTNSATGCHPGTTRNWDASGASCNSCHGASSGGSGAPLIAGDMLSTNPVGQHNTHVNTEAMGCAICHDGGHNATNGMTGQDDKLQIAFTGLGTGGNYNPPGTWTAGKWLYNQTSTTATQDCSNLYCHSSGQADGGVGAPTYATPSWGNAASGACGTCHATSPATGSHTVHLADSADCNNCHSGNNHVDKMIDVTSVNYTSAGAPGNGYGTCSTASCHDDGTGVQVTTPTWGTTSACNECHAAVPTTNAHSLHLALTGVNCATCHDGAVEGANPGTAHRDGFVNVLNGYSDTTKGAPYGTCSTASCHDDGQGNPVTTPVWNVDAPNCTACHAVAPATGSHTAHFNDGAVCTVCHAGAVEGMTASTNHLSGDVNIDAIPLNGYANNPAALGTGSWTTCSTASCHVTGQAAAAYAVTPVWGVNAPNCSQCHLASPTTGSHAKHIATTNDCATCHTSALKDTSYVSTAHRDNNVDVAVGGYTANKTLGSPKESCSINCHSDGMAAVGTSPIWGTAGGACDVCHLSNMTTGSHSIHLASAATCGNCHDGAVKDNNAGSAHTDGNVDVTAGYATANAPYGNGSWTTCNAASCHDDGTGTLVTTPAWGTASTCNECHSNVPTTNAHGTHLALSGVNCGTCHTGAVQDVNPGGTHRNGTVEVLFGYTDNSKGAPYGTCSTASCHNNGLGVAVASPAWNGASNCSSCHTTPPGTGSHSIHLSNTEAGTISCGNCHSNATTSVSPSGVHANNNVDVFDVASGDLGYPTTAVLGSSSWSSCNAASCHDNGTGTLVTTPTWGTSAACTECHTTVPATGAHTKHLSQTITSTIKCTDCHSGAVWSSASPTTGHRDGNIDVTGGYGYPLNVAKGGSPYDSCGTSYCHGDAMPKGTTSGTTNAPNWGATSTGCTFCHDMAPAAISAHAGKTATDCISCHDNVNAAGTGFVDKTLHINGTLEGGGDNCFDCHANIGTGLSGAHATHVTTAYTGALSTNDYGNAANGWYRYTNTGGTYDIGCGYCHPSDVAGHMTKQISLSPSDPNAAGTLKAKNNASAAYSFGTGVCSATYCHSDGANVAGGASPAWMTGSIAGNCNECHGNSPTTNAHSVHSVGIHYTDLYDSDRNGVMQAAAATNAAHGNTATSTTITCVICHSDTVSLTQNDTNDVCTTCHSGATTKGNLGIKTGSGTHLNGQPDVVFNLSGFKTTAQLRDDITKVTELNNSWTRTNGYKNAATGTSHDAANALTPGFASGSCSAIVCHNGNSANWSDPVASNCQKCHTALPQ